MANNWLQFEIYLRLNTFSFFYLLKSIFKYHYASVSKLPCSWNKSMEFFVGLIAKPMQIQREKKSSKHLI